MEVYVPTMRQLLNEKNHGVLLTGVCLVTEMCRVNPDSLNHFKRVSISVSLCEYIVFVGTCSCLATEVFRGNLPAMGEGWVIWSRLHDINWGALNHASLAPQLMSHNYHMLFMCVQSNFCTCTCILHKCTCNSIQDSSIHYYTPTWQHVCMTMPIVTMLLCRALVQCHNIALQCELLRSSPALCWEHVCMTTLYQFPCRYFWNARKFMFHMHMWSWK